MSALTYFKVIEIFDDRNPYPMLLGIDWATDTNGVINLKKHKMVFEKKSLHVVVPLDATEGACYTKPMRDDDSDDNLDCIYKITAREQDWVNPIAYGRIFWDHESSYT